MDAAELSAFVERCGEPAYRGRQLFGEELERSLESVEQEKGWDHRILFIESDDPSLVRRYKESRRPHPAARNGDVLEAIRRERRDLSTLREMDDLIVDTSGYSALDARLRFKIQPTMELKIEN